MIHSSCGSLNPNSIYIIDGKYKKEYIKEFGHEIKENVNGYPLYKMRNNFRIFKMIKILLLNILKGNNTEVDNR